MAMKPLAPGRGSTTTGCDHARESLSASTRVKTAGAAPAEYGAVIFTTFVGNGCASAAGIAVHVAQARITRVLSAALIIDASCGRRVEVGPRYMIAPRPRSSVARPAWAAAVKGD